MKVEKNKLYYAESPIKRKLISEDLMIQDDAKEKSVEEETIKELALILESNITTNGHRCISVYRDAFVLGKDVYNVCLSCGDFYKNDKNFYLSPKGIQEFKDLAR